MVPVAGVGVLVEWWMNASNCERVFS